jgi:glycosyltransferase involved in cell wall biosynthesis
MNPIAWISKADVFALPSLWEGFGNIVVDALAARTTIVSTNCKSGPAEILDNGKYGYLLSSFDPEEMASKIKEALHNPTDKKLLQSRAELFEKNYIMLQYEGLIKEVYS